MNRRRSGDLGALPGFWFWYLVALGAVVFLSAKAFSDPIELIAKDGGYVVACGGVEVSTHNTERKATQSLINEIMRGSEDCEFTRVYRVTGTYTPIEPEPLACSSEQDTVDALLAEAAEVEAAIAAKQDEIAAQEQALADCGAGDPQYTQLAPLAGSDNYVDYYMPVYNSPEEGWAMIEAMCGPVGEWEHEITVPYQEAPYDSGINTKNMEGCIHIKGELGPNGERPYMPSIGSTKGYRGDLREGGIFVENFRTVGFGVPNDQHFMVLHNVHMEGWSNHAFITSGGNKHMYVEVLDFYAGKGDNNHAFYIDNVAYANIQRGTIESPGRQHALRSIAQAGTYKDLKLCNVNCDGTVHWQHGAPPLDIYVNGRHTVENVDILYKRPPGVVTQAANFRSRPHLNSLDRYWDGESDSYTPLVWGTEHYNDPATWSNMPMIDTTVTNMTIECPGEPCTGWSIASTYPQEYTYHLGVWWANNEFPDWATLLANADPSWHNTLDLMTPIYRQRRLDRGGSGLPHSGPMAVPEGWQQKARITFENVTGNFTQLYDIVEGDTASTDFGSWCAGERDGETCLKQGYYKNAEVIVR